MGKLEELIKHLCPYGVEHKKLKEICKFQNGFAFKSTLFKDIGYPILRITNINNGIVSNSIDEYVYFNERDYKENLQAYQVKKGDIVIAMSGATTGKIGYNYSDNIYFLNQRVGMFIPNERFLLKRYLYHWLCGQRNNILNISSGTGAQPNLSSIKMMDFKIAVPPLQIQEEIVHILDNFKELSEKLLEELLEELKARQQQYEYYTNYLLNNSQNIKRVKLGELCEVITKGTTPRNFTKEGIAFIKTEAFVGNRIDLNKLSYIDEDTHKGSLKRSILQEDDILITIAGATIGKCVMVPKEILPANTNQALAIIRLKKNVNKKYIFFILQSFYMKEYIQKKVKGSAQPNLNLQQLNEFEFPYPNEIEQERIIRILEKFNKLANDISEGLSAEIEARQKQYEYYRDKLLTFKELNVEN